MMSPHAIVRRLSTMLLPLALLTITTQAQTARIKLDSLDRLASKALEMVRKEEKAKGGESMVYVRCFEFKQAGDYEATDLQEIRAQLQTPGWSRFMKVEDKGVDRGENESTEIYIFGRTAGSDTFGGMTIIATEPKEFTVVNIVGQGNINEIMRKAKQGKPPK